MERSECLTFAQAHESALLRLRASRVVPRDAAHSDVRVLLDFLTGCSHAHLAYADRLLTPAQQQQFSRALEDLCAGRPLAYITGRREWFGLQFKCDARALIPRPETELIVEAVLRSLLPLNLEQSPMVADLGTGSGCIAIALATALPRAQLFATDVSRDALALARDNARTLGVAQRICFRAGTCDSWAAPLREQCGHFAVVVSNPPYIASGEMAALQTQIKDFEPGVALDGGPDGLDCYRKIAAQCGPLLQTNGVLFYELGAGQFAEVKAIFQKWGWKVGEPIFDLQGIARVLTARRAT